jgi:DNA-3-methyladenine glycosylase II
MIVVSDRKENSDDSSLPSRECGFVAYDLSKIFAQQGQRYVTRKNGMTVMIDLKARPACPGWTGAERHLSKVDPILRRIIRRVGPCTLAPRKDYFAALCQSILNQQISTQVAIVIYNRFRDLFPRRRPTPEALLQIDDVTLRGVGLSRQKLLYLRSLAEAFASGNVPVRRFNRMDEEIIQSLIPVKGIGRWTVEMFLMFVLNRPDVLPVDDLGLKKGVQQAFGLPELPKAPEIIDLAQSWRPYRTVATWYLWRTGWPDMLKKQKVKVTT